MPTLLDYLGVSKNTMSLRNKSITGQDHFPQKTLTFQMILEIGGGLMKWTDILRFEIFLAVGISVP